MAQRTMSQIKKRWNNHMKMKIFASFIFVLIQLNIVAVCARGIPILRDAEIENILYEATRPLFSAANLNPKSVKLYLVNDQFMMTKSIDLMLDKKIAPKI